MNKGVLYEKVASKIKSDILSGKYPVGDLLPTEIQLEEIFGVSKITIRKAVQILTDEGYLRKRSGKGTRVISDRLFNKLSKAVSYSTILEKDHTLEKDFISLEIFDVDPKDSLYDFMGKQTLRLIRVYYLDGTPFIYFEHYFPMIEVDLQNAFKEIEKNSIYKWLSNYGYMVSSFVDEFDIASVSTAIKNILKLDVEQMLFRKRISKDKDGGVVEISYGYYNTKMKPYVIAYEI